MLTLFTILRPLCGLEEFLEECLESSFKQSWTAYEVIFTVQDEDDPAIPIAKKVMRQNPHVRSRLLIGKSNYANNGKLNNMIKGERIAVGGVIISADANVLLPPDTYDRMFRFLLEDVGLICSPPIGTRPLNFWGWVEAAFLNTFQAKWQILADFFHFGFTQGKVMAWIRGKFDYGNVSFLVQLDSELAEDAAATKLIRSRGKRVALASKLFEQPIGHRTLSYVWKRQMRWAILRRLSFPFLYSLELVTTLLLFGLSFYFFGWTVLMLYALGILSELLLAWTVGWPCSWQLIPAIIVRDILITLIWLIAWVNKRFEWKNKFVSA